MKLKLNCRLTLEQKKLYSDLDSKQKELSVVQIQKPSRDNYHCDLEDKVETIKVNLRCVDENVKELEENILQVEDSQVFLLFRFFKIFKIYSLQNYDIFRLFLKA